MPAIVAKAFGGMRPAVERHLLDPSEAVTSTNTRLVTGGLEPLLAPTVLRALAVPNAQTIWRYGNNAAELNWWFEFPGVVDIIRSPIPNDQWDRAYWTGEGNPRYGPNSLLLSGTGALPGGSYLLGVPAPTVQPGITATAGSGSTAETRSYVYTYVTAYGEEGPPSLPSPPTSIEPTAPVTVTGMATGPGGQYNITAKRIYRTSTVGSAAQFQFVAEVAVATTSFVDNVAQASLGEVLATADFTPPPAGLQGLKLMANGAAIGFVGNTAYMSEPNLPHAWPHRVTVEDAIVGIGVFSQGVVLLTNGHPYFMTGADPAAMLPERYREAYACLSKRSIVEAGDGCVYASTTGLVSVGPGGGLDVITKRLLTRTQWEAYNPASMIAAFVDGKYHCLYTTTGGVRGMLIFDLSGEGALMSTCDISAATPVNAVYGDPRSSTLYMSRGASIERHDRGAPLTMIRRSGEYRLPSPCNMACIAVDADAYPVTARVFADGALVHTATIASQFAQRMPSGYEARSWQVEIESPHKVTRWAIATSISELKAAA